MFAYIPLICVRAFWEEKFCSLPHGLGAAPHTE
jgi:hypothetical protein